MFFFNDECDLVDDDQYDFFTLATPVERRRFVDRPCSRQTDKEWHCLSISDALGNPEA